MRQKIEKILKETLKIDQLPENPTQENTENWDSLHHLNLVIELEMEFDIELEPEEIAIMTSIEQIEAIIKTKL